MGGLGTIGVRLTAQVYQARSRKIEEDKVSQVGSTGAGGEIVVDGGGERPVAELVRGPGELRRIAASCRPEKPGQTGMDESLCVVRCMSVCVRRCVEGVRYYINY